MSRRLSRSLHAAFLLTGSVFLALQAEAQNGAPVFAKDVAPILYRNCTTCHRPNGLGPMSLLTYEAAKKAAPDIRDAVSSGVMPPWHADAPQGHFLNDRRLSAAEKQTILSWIDKGAPAGDMKDLPAAPTYETGWTIGKPDVVITMPEEYEVPAKGVIDYQYFEVPTNFTEDKWVQSLEILPGAREVVHHVLVFARPPRVAPQPRAPGSPAPTPVPPLLIRREDHGLPDPPARPDGTRQPDRALGALIGTTAPGTNVVTFPAGTALRVRAGSVITFQMHYTAHGHATKDRSSVGMVFAKEPPAQEIRANSFQNGQFVIPAGATNHEVPAEIGFRDSVRVWGLFPHTHLRGKRWEYHLVQPDGKSEKILSVPGYDFNWQTYYMFATPLVIAPGARIVSTAWYDNSSTNPSNPDATKEVRWGDQTWEEMQYTGFLWSLVRPPAPPPRP
jgi:hypothetical protein